MSFVFIVVIIYILFLRSVVWDFMDIRGSLGFLPSDTNSFSVGKGQIQASIERDVFEICTNLETAQKNTSCEESSLKYPSQIEEGGVSQQKKLRVFWTKEEREVLRKLVYDYKTRHSESVAIKWNIITGLFNQIMQEKDSSRPLRTQKRVSEQWSNYESSDVIQGNMSGKHKIPLLQLFSYFARKNTEEKISWSLLRKFIKEHNGGYCYSDNALKNFYNSSVKNRYDNLFKEAEEISEDEAVEIAKSLQLQSKPVENEEKCTILVESAKTGPLKKRALEGEDSSNNPVKSVRIGVSEIGENLHTAQKNTSCEESNLKRPSQIEECCLSQQKKSRVFWTEEEREVLRKTVYDYKTTCSEGAPIKWSCITSVFNRIMKEKDSSRPLRTSKNLLRKWRYYENSLSIQRTIQKKHEMPLFQLISYFSRRNTEEKINWAALSDFIKDHNKGYCYSANALKNLYNYSSARLIYQNLCKEAGEISEDEAVKIAESLQLQRESVENEEKSTSIVESAKSSEESNLKSHSQIDAVRSQQKKPTIFWTEQEKAVLRKVVYDYKTSQPEGVPIKWGRITDLFNQTMQEKDSSRPLRTTKNLLEKWNNYESSFVIQGKISGKHARPLFQLISYFSRRNTNEKVSWAALRDFIKEHNGGYYYSDNALKNLYNCSSARLTCENLCKEAGEISEDEAVKIAESLQLQLESVENEEKCTNIVESAKTRSLKEIALEDLDWSCGEDGFVFDPDVFLSI